MTTVASVRLAQSCFVFACFFSPLGFGTLLLFRVSSMPRGYVFHGCNRREVFAIYHLWSRVTGYRREIADIAQTKLQKCTSPIRIRRFPKAKVSSLNERRGFILECILQFSKLEFHFQIPRYFRQVSPVVSFSHVWLPSTDDE